MSDLAPFVAAAIRDRVVIEQQKEIKIFQKDLLESQNVSITDRNGHPIYAQANFVTDGNYDINQRELWKVEFPSIRINDNDTTSSTDGGGMTTTTTSTCHHHDHCSLEDLSELQIRVGGICKGRMFENEQIEGFVNDVRNNYCSETKSGKISIWFGCGSAGVWLSVRIQPISKEQYSELRDYDLSGSGLVSTLIRYFHQQQQQLPQHHDGDRGNRQTTVPGRGIVMETPTTMTSVPSIPSPIRVYFTDVSFLVCYMNGAMERWGVLQRRGDDDDDDHDDDHVNGRYETDSRGLVGRQIPVQQPTRQPPPPPQQQQQQQPVNMDQFLQIRQSRTSQHPYEQQGHYHDIPPIIIDENFRVEV